MKIPVIYKIRNVVNSKFYVGSTGNTRERFRCHRNRLRNNKHHCRHLQAAWNKYGEECFVFEIVERVDNIDNLQTVENVWLEAHVGKDYCYNKSRYSDAPMRGVAKEDNPLYGRKKSDAQKLAISNTLKTNYALGKYAHPRLGKKHNAETKQLISEKRKGKYGGVRHYRYGKVVSDEVRKKIGDTQRGVKKAPRVYTAEGLEKAQANMKRNAKEQQPSAIGEVLSKFPIEVLGKYDFTNAIYTGALNRITGCICLNHGEFSQYAAQFRKGSGCPKCGAEARAKNKGKQMADYWQTDEGRSKFMENRKNKKLDKQ